MPNYVNASSQAPKKAKLKKSLSISSPIRSKREWDHSAHSPFTSPRQGRSTMAVKSKEAEDRHGYMAILGDPKKSSSSPELSSPPAVPKGNRGKAKENSATLTDLIRNC